MSVQRSVRFPDEVAAAIEAEAKELDRSFAWVVVRAVRAELGRGKRTVAMVEEFPDVPVEPRIDTEYLERKVRAHMDRASESQKPSLADVPGLKRGSEVKARSKAFVCPVASCQWVGSDTSDGFCPVHGRELMARRS